ncbi:MAG TPA: CBS domain-containing protein [Myxococcota bacterium]|nr:CBS domain-containing protein [Myxococcota bacterium]
MMRDLPTAIEPDGAALGELLAAAGPGLFGALPCHAIARGARAIEAADPDEPLQDAVSRMWWKQVGALAVVAEGVLLGSLSEDDLLRVCAGRLAALGPGDEAAPGLTVWDDLLGGLRVGDAMTPHQELPRAATSTPLLEGVEQIASPSAAGTRSRHLWVVTERDEPVRVISIRDIARYLTRLYDRDFPADPFESADLHAGAGRLSAAVLDLTIGSLRERIAIGGKPVAVALEASGSETLRRMWQDGRGYAIALLPDGAPLGICTRRDLLRALRHPYAKLADLRAARLMTLRVKTVTDVDTLCGLFKLMAIEGCRHMPLVDEGDRVQCVISMWEAVGLLGLRPEPGR